MKKWVLISDLLFAFFVAFLTSVCLTRYLGLSLPLALLASIFIGAGIVALVALFKKRKDDKLLLLRGEEKEKQLLLTHLTLLPPEKALLFLTDKKEGFSTCQNLPYLEEEGELHVPLFLWRKVELHDLLPAVRLCLDKQKTGTIYCDEISPEADGFLAQFSIRAVKGVEIYRRCKEANKLPKRYVSEPYFTKKKKRLPRVWFAKSNSRRFLLCGGLLLLSSLLVPFPYYYLVFGGILVLAAVLIRILGYR